MASYDRSSMLSNASLEYKKKQACACPTVFYEAPQTMLKKGVKRGGDGGTFCHSAIKRSLARELQCPEAFYEPPPGVGYGVAGSHGIVQRAERWIDAEDDISPGPIYVPSVDGVRPKSRQTTFSKGERFPAPKPQFVPRVSTPAGGGEAGSAGQLSSPASFRFTSSSVDKKPRCTFGQRVPDPSQPREASRSRSPPQSRSTTRRREDRERAKKRESSIGETADGILGGRSRAVSVPFPNESLLMGRAPTPEDGDGGGGAEEEEEQILALANESKLKKKLPPVGPSPADRPGAKKVLKTRATESTPGPGHFLSSAFKPSSVQCSMGRRFRERNVKTPGPGAYDIAKAWRSGKPKCETFSRSGHNALFGSASVRGCDSPGPSVHSRLVRTPVDPELNYTPARRRDGTPASSAVRPSS